MSSSFVCENCNKSFNRKYNYEQHYNNNVCINQKIKKNNTICKYCDRKFTRKDNMIIHIQKYCDVKKRINNKNTIKENNIIKDDIIEDNTIKYDNTSTQHILSCSITNNYNINNYWLFKI
jgi:hypothetical protein